MSVMSKALGKSKKSAHFQWDNCVMIVNINCNWSITLCDNCNQSIMTCGQDEVSIKTWNGQIRVFHDFTEGYINWEHKGMVMCHVWKPG